MTAQSVTFTAVGSYFKVWTGDSAHGTLELATARMLEMLQEDPKVIVETSFDFRGSGLHHVWKLESKHTTDHKAKESAANLDLEDSSRVLRITTPDLYVEAKADTVPVAPGDVLRFEVQCSNPERATIALVPGGTPQVDVTVIEEGDFSIGVVQVSR